MGKGHLMVKDVAAMVSDLGQRTDAQIGQLATMLQTLAERIAGTNPVAPAAVNPVASAPVAPAVRSIPNASNGQRWQIVDDSYGSVPVPKTDRAGNPLYQQVKQADGSIRTVEALEPKTVRLTPVSRERVDDLLTGTKVYALILTDAELQALPEGMRRRATEGKPHESAGTGNRGIAWPDGIGATVAHNGVEVHFVAGNGSGIYAMAQSAQYVLTDAEEHTRHVECARALLATGANKREKGTAIADAIFRKNS